MMFLDEDGKRRFSLELQQLLTDSNDTEVLSMIERENLSDLVDCDGTTLLHLSAKYRSKCLIDYLSHRENLDVNAVNHLGETPLMWALQSHNGIGIVMTLLDAGADLWKIKNNSGQCALSIFIRRYREDEHIAKLVMDEIVKRCKNNQEIVDALMSADCQLYHLFLFKDVEITKLMLERGCSVNLKDFEYERNTALHCAAKMNDLNNVKVLLQFGADKNIKNVDNCPPIGEVLNSGNSDMELIKLLLPDGNDWIDKGENLAIIFDTCKKEVLQFLLEHYNIDFNAKDANGQTTLHHLVANRDLRVWELLKNKKFNVNACDKYGSSVLHKAAKFGNPEAIQFLIDAGANVNILNKKGKSPLFSVTWVGEWCTTRDLEGLELLLQHKANLQLIIENGDSIVSHLRGRRFYALLDPVLTHLAIIETCGASLNPVILCHINATDYTKKIFMKCKQELDEMKTKTISGTVTFFKFLTAEDRKIYKYVQNEEIVKEVSEIQGEGYLHRLFMKRFQRAMEIGRLRKIATQLICECIELFDGYDLIIENILDFLDITDLRLIAMSSD